MGLYKQAEGINLRDAQRQHQLVTVAEELPPSSSQQPFFLPLGLRSAASLPHWLNERGVPAWNNLPIPATCSTDPQGQRKRTQLLPFAQVAKEFPRPLPEAHSVTDDSPRAAYCITVGPPDSSKLHYVHTLLLLGYKFSESRGQPPDPHPRLDHTPPAA